MDRPAICFRSPLLFFAVFVLLTGLFGLRVAASDAAVFCVGSEDALCAESSNDPQASLDAARDNPGADMVRIYEGTYTGTFTYTDDSPDNLVEIKGVGEAGDVEIVLADTSGSKIGLWLDATAGSSVENLTVTIPTNADPDRDLGIMLGHGTLADEVGVTGPNASNAIGILCDECEITDTTVELVGGETAGNIGVVGSAGDMLLADSTVRSNQGVMVTDPEATATILRSRLTAQIAARTDGATLELKDSVIEIGSDDGIGVLLANGFTGSHQMKAVLDGVTIVGDSTATGTRGLLASADDGDESALATIRNSVIASVDKPLVLYAAEKRRVDVETSYSAYDRNAVEEVEVAGGEVGYSSGPGPVDLADGAIFNSLGGDDFTPAADSVLVDTGDPAGLPAGATDFNGNPRACQGTGTGVIRRDIGAIERKTHAADDCSYPDTSITSGPEAYPPAMHSSNVAEFKLASTKAGSTFTCSIDGGPFTDCSATWTTPALPRGSHTFRARAIDAFGNVDQTPVERVVYLGEPKAPPPSCKTDPALCPDRTAPKILGLKTPKKTRLARVKIAFRSNEKGVAFTCRLNQSKFRKCKSPWLTPKLRKGRNSIRIRATDKAGNRSKVATRVIKRVVKKKARRR